MFHAFQFKTHMLRSYVRYQGRYHLVRSRCSIQYIALTISITGWDLLGTCPHQTCYICDFEGRSTWVDLVSVLRL